MFYYTGLSIFWSAANFISRIFGSGFCLQWICCQNLLIIFRWIKYMFSSHEQYMFNVYNNYKKQNNLIFLSRLIHTKLNFILYGIYLWFGIEFLVKWNYHFSNWFCLRMTAFQINKNIYIFMIAIQCFSKYFLKFFWNFKRQNFCGITSERSERSSYYGSFNWL